MTVRQPIAILVAFLVSVLAAACSEHLAGGAACPVYSVFCPGQNLQNQVVDTTFRIDHSAPVYDTTVASYPLLGNEGTLLVASIPNRADVRGIMRFDSLQITYQKTVDDTSATEYAAVARHPLLSFAVDARTVSATRGSDRITFNVYDVDSPADTVVSQLVPLFSSQRLIGQSASILASQLRDTTNSRSLDTVEIHLDSVFMKSKILGDRKLRLGITVSANGNVTDGVRLTIDENVAPFVRYYGSPKDSSDTTFGRIASQLRSSTPVTDSTLLTRLVHYPVIVRGALDDSVDALNIGGIPARRVFMRFGLPSRIIDTANVIRATLLLSPRPQLMQIPGDSAVIYPEPVISSNKVMTPAQAANFLIPNTTFGLDSVMVVPSANARVAFDIVNAVKNWQNISDTLNTRAMVLRILNEGGTTLESSFWSSYAPDTALRPHVRIVFVKRSKFGLP